MSLTLSMTLTLGLLAQAPPTQDSVEDPSAWLAIMKASAATYEIRRVVGAEAREVLVPHKELNNFMSVRSEKIITDVVDRPLRLQADPVLRFTNTVGATRDGAIFLWLDDEDRPTVAAQVFVKRDGDFVHELTSLSPGRVVGKAPGAPDWRPSRPGVEFKPVPNAPRPAESPEQRLRQMQGLAREFSAEDLFREKSWQPLRMLTRPFARYGKTDSRTIDGALFAYVLTTDPEVYLMIEARAGKVGPEWQYAFAPMTIYSVRASWKGQPVWELPTRWDVASRPVESFYFREHVQTGEIRKP